MTALTRTSPPSPIFIAALLVAALISLVASADDALKLHDPEYPNQWNLNASNVQQAWTLGYLGQGVIISIVDAGSNWNHPDLKDSYVKEFSWDFNSNDSDPTPHSDRHGTCAAGAAMAISNTACGVGVAPRAKFSAVRLIEDSSTFEMWMAAAALSNHRDNVSIFSCSWGPSDTSPVYYVLGELLETALSEGALLGRNGKGNIFVWASGNGRSSEDNVNNDQFANSPWTMAIGAYTHSLKWPSYAEQGAPILAVAPSSGDNGFGIIAPGLGSDCVNNFGETSAACPQAAGVVAMMLSANPELYWYEVQDIIARTSIMIDETDAGWAINGAGLHVNHKYGFGRIDAYAAVSQAVEYKDRPAKTEDDYFIRNFTFDVPADFQAIPNGNDEGYSFLCEVEGSYEVTRVQASIYLLDPWTGDLSISLESPNGTISKLAVPRQNRQQNSRGLIVKPPGKSASNLTMTIGSFAAVTYPIIAPIKSVEWQGHDAFLDGCTPFIDDGYEGAIAVVADGGCTAVEKATNALFAGAAALIIISTTESTYLAQGPGANGNITIPVVVITKSNGTWLHNQLHDAETGGGLPVTGTLYQNYGRNPSMNDIFAPWTFSTVHHWGENAQGIWKLHVVDAYKNYGAAPTDDMAILKNWSISFHGAQSLQTAEQQTPTGASSTMEETATPQTSSPSEDASSTGTNDGTPVTSAAVDFADSINDEADDSPGDSDGGDGDEEEEWVMPFWMTLGLVFGGTFLVIASIILGILIERARRRRNGTSSTASLDKEPLNSITDFERHSVDHQLEDFESPPTSPHILGSADDDDV